MPINPVLPAMHYVPPKRRKHSPRERERASYNHRKLKDNITEREKKENGKHKERRKTPTKDKTNTFFL
jgi:hypothetical protein